jgi:hypothetical protein
LFEGIRIARKPQPDPEATAERHNRVAEQIVTKIVDETLAAGGDLTDIMVLCESVLVGVVVGCFRLGSDVKALDLIVGQVKERLAKVRLEDIQTRGSG